jgi:hypothetical protein
MWIATLAANVTFNDQPVTKAFMKIGINPRSIRIRGGDYPGKAELSAKAAEQKTKASGLMYEFQVYENVIGPILASHVCPNFLRPYLVSYNCKMEDLLSALQFGMKQFDDPTLQNLLLRSVDFMSNGKKERPAIHDANGLDPDAIPDADPNLRFMVLTTEYENVISYWKFLSPNTNMDMHRRMSVLLQILVALYVMEKSKLAHNDLHVGNILIQGLDQPTTFTYIINGEVFSIRTDVKALVYDWDWSACESLGANRRIGNQLKPFDRNRDLVRLYKSMTPKNPIDDPNLDPQQRSLMHEVFDLSLINPEIVPHRSKGAEMPLPLLEAIRLTADAFEPVDPSAEPYIINDDRFLSNGALNIDYACSADLRRQHQASLEKCEQENASLKRRMEKLEAQMSFTNSLLRKRQKREG